MLSTRRLACAAALLAALSSPVSAASPVAVAPTAHAVAPPVQAALLERFAPLVLLAPGERALPANVDWFLARSQLDPAPAPAPRMTQASLIGDLGAAFQAVRRGLARLRPSRAARHGSEDPSDWQVYGHVYRARGGGVLLQYWFFYAFNDFHVLFDHEGDWEHVTVKLDADDRPTGAWYARHDWSAPGRWFAWSDLEREGDHPVVLSARGSHASYASSSDVLFWDRACPTRVVADAARAGCRVWRTWAEGTGGIVPTGPRGHPSRRAEFLAWPGRWGVTGWFGRATGGPRGPAYQRSWCAEGDASCS